MTCEVPLRQERLDAASLDALAEVIDEGFADRVLPLYRRLLRGDGR
jgi:hypothetical protein